MKKRRALTISFLALFLVVGIPTGFVVSEYHHIQVNRALVTAVKADDTKSADTALNAGAEADYPRRAPRPLWLQWLDRMTGLKAPAKEMEPSLLAQAVQHNNTVLVKALLEKGATDVQGFAVSLLDRQNVEAMPLLSIAAEAGNIEICQALMEHGAEVDTGGNNCPLKMAAEGGHSAVIRFLFEHGAKVDRPESSVDDCSLMAAASHGDAECVRLLLAHGADATFASRWGSVLNKAVYRGNLAVVKLLVEAGADVNIGGTEVGSPLQNAAEVGDVEIVRYLLSHGADVNEGYFRSMRPPLLEAVKGGHTEVVRLLLDHSADWREKVELGGMGFTQGDTALRVAQRKENRDIIQMLKNAGAKE